MRQASAGSHGSDHGLQPPPAVDARLSDRVNVLGVGISAINPISALERIRKWIADDSREYVCVCTVHTVMESQKSEQLRMTINSSGMTTPDGMPLVWLAHLAGRQEVSRVYGPDLMLAVMEKLPRKYGHFLFGGGPGVAERLAKAMTSRFPGLNIAGTYSPPMGSVEDLATDEVAALINECHPQVVWIGISTPKQDQWMNLMRPLLRAPVLIGVGAAFDFHSGTVRQAPGWMQRSGLEWLFRLSQEPRRLWRRYLIYNSWFIFCIMRQKMGLRKYELT